MISPLAWISVRDFPAINASLNVVAGMLLIVGYVLIRFRKERAHRVAMIGAFFVSTLFLVCYLIYHYHVQHVPFEGPPTARAIYLLVLFTHIPLAALVPLLAVGAIYLGVTNRRTAHRRLARWTLPIWLYVSATGVIVYVMLYHLYPSAEQGL